LFLLKKQAKEKNDSDLINILNMKLGISFKISAVLFLAGVGPLLLFYFLAVQSYQELAKLFPQLESVLPELAKEMTVFYGNIGIQFGLVFLLTLILIGFLSVLYGRYLIGSINKLIKGAKKIAKGNYAVKINIKTGDELEVLGETFNKMAGELKGQSEALQEAKSTLEIKVKARTSELRELAKSLDEKVKQRTKELQKRVEELERFHSLTVGRELKMIELKKEIKKLQKETEKRKK